MMQNLQYIQKKTIIQNWGSTTHGNIIPPTLFNIYISDTPTPQAPVKLRTYANGIYIYKNEIIPTGKTLLNIKI